MRKRFEAPFLAVALVVSTAVAEPVAAADPDAATKRLARAFQAICLDTGLAMDDLRKAWSGLVKHGAELTERTIDARTADPQARTGAPKISGMRSDGTWLRLDGKLELEGGTYLVAVVNRRGHDRLDVCRIEAAVENIDTVVDGVVTALGLAEPKVVAASQSSTYLNDPDPTIFKYVRYAPRGPISVTVGLELKPHGRGNLLLIAEPATRE